MRLPVPFAVLACSMSLSACALAPPQDGEAPSGFKLPSFPSVSALLPSADSIIPTLPSNTEPQKSQPVGANLYRVKIDDRRIADSVQRENYALLRAAETTKEAGGTHFIVVSGGNTLAAYGGRGLGSAPDLGALIRVVKVVPGAEAPMGAVAADEIIHFFGPAFGRSPEGSPT